MVVTIQPMDLILSQNINVLNVINGIPFKGWDREILEYIYSKYSSKAEVVVDDAGIRAYLLEEMRNQYLIENGHSSDSTITEDDNGVLWIGGTDVEDVPDAADAMQAWKSFIERNDNYVWEAA